MEGMVPSRPLTHDLLKNTLDTFEIEVTEILINNLVEGVFSRPDRLHAAWP
jgi:bifunctional DNase/RNase